MYQELSLLKHSNLYFIIASAENHNLYAKLGGEV